MGAFGCFCFSPVTMLCFCFILFCFNLVAQQIFLGKECFGVVKPLFSPRKVKLKTPSTVKKCHFFMAV